MWEYKTQVIPERYRVLDETTIVVDVDGTERNLIVRKFGNRIFSKSEKAKLLKTLYTNGDPLEVIIGGVDNIIDAYKINKNRTRVIPENNPKYALYEIPGQNNFRMVYDNLHSEIIAKLKESGVFKGLVDDADIDSDITPGGDLTYLLPYEKTTVADIKKRYAKSGLPYVIIVGLERDTYFNRIGNNFLVTLKIPFLIKSEPITIKL